MTTRSLDILSMVREILSVHFVQNMRYWFSNCFAVLLLQQLFTKFFLNSIKLVIVALFFLQTIYSTTPEGHKAAYMNQAESRISLVPLSRIFFATNKMWLLNKIYQ
jgi:hypothetical protein